MGRSSRRRTGRRALADAVRAAESLFALTGRPAPQASVKTEVHTACLFTVLSAYGGWVDIEILCEAVKQSRSLPIWLSGADGVARLMADGQVEHRWRGRRLDVKAKVQAEDDAANGRTAIS